FRGKDAIHDWIASCMSEYPGRDMPEFPIEWYVIDEERGWVVCQVWNRMRDPGDGSLHQEYNFTLLKYAGAGRWSYEEDIYNPIRFGAMVEGWEAARKAASPAGS
ncbi:MAG: nuclear transport factor 2 family protein, partial [Acidimicrobiales bacterium]